MKAFHPNSQIHTWALTLLIVHMKLRVWSIKTFYVTACGNTKTLSFRIKPRHPPTVPQPTKTLAKFKVARATKQYRSCCANRIQFNLYQQLTIAVTILEFCQGKVVLIGRCVKFALRPGGRRMIWHSLFYTTSRIWTTSVDLHDRANMYCNKEWQRHDDLDRTGELRMHGSANSASASESTPRGTHCRVHRHAAEHQAEPYICAPLGPGLASKKQQQTATSIYVHE